LGDEALPWNCSRPRVTIVRLQILWDSTTTASRVAISFNVVEKYFDDFAKDYSKENFESTGIKLF
jgi:hypothetical protein